MAGTMINDLPDGILHHIVSLLPTEDAVRTSILAKRWRYFWTFLTVLDLKRSWSNIHDFPNGIRFPLLKTLNLSHITFENENSAEQLFSLSPVLQELTFYDCFWHNIKQITIASSTLRTLIFHSDSGSVYLNNYNDNCILKVDAVSMKFLSYICYSIVKLVPVNLTSVVKAYIDSRFRGLQNAHYAAHCAIELLSEINRFKSIPLSNDTLEDTLHLLPSFQSLTHLHVFWLQFDGASKIIGDFLPKTRMLENLQLRIFNGGLSTLNMPDCLKSTLKLVCIYDFYAAENQIELVNFLLENTSGLREIKICWVQEVKYEFEMNQLMDHIKNKMQPSPSSKCVITFE